jgi:hypothetical protein
MRFLIYQDKQCPGWVYDTCKEVAATHGHTFVKWEAHLQLGKHFDGVLVFPRPADGLNYLCQGVLSEKYEEDEDDDDITVEVGRGVYEGLNAKRPNTYLVAYDDEHDHLNRVELVQGYELERGDSSDDYNEWGKIWLKDVKSSGIGVAFKMIARGISPNTVGPVASGIIDNARRLLLLLINR